MHNVNELISATHGTAGARRKSGALRAAQARTIVEALIVRSELRSVLSQCCQDEVAHKEDAQRRLRHSSGWLARLWGSAIAAGSALAVALARRL